MGISLDSKDYSGLLSKFSSFILDYWKLLSENIQVCLGVQCHGLLVILLFFFLFSLSSVHSNFIKDCCFCSISVPDSSIFPYFIFVKIVWNWWFWLCDSGFARIACRSELVPLNSASESWALWSMSRLFSNLDWTIPSFPLGLCPFLFWDTEWMKAYLFYIYFQDKEK